MCLTAAFVYLALRYLIIVAIVVAVLRIALPFALAPLGAIGGAAVQIVNILIWGVVALFVLWFCWHLLECLGPPF